MKRCTACGEKTETLITNVGTWESKCPSCCWGADQFMLRRVLLTTKSGTEIHTVWAVNNLHAFQLLWRLDVLEGIAAPLPN
jgi:hypothetical protein